MNSPRPPRETLVLILTVVAILTGVMSGCAGFAQPAAPLALSPSSISLRSTAGSSTAGMVTVTNTGIGNTDVSQVAINGAGFSVTGLTTPFRLSAGQSASFTVKFAATSTGSVNGTLAILTDEKHRPAVAALHGTATPKGSSNPTDPGISSVTVAPASVTLAPNAKQQFTATLAGATTDNTVTWTASIGSITSLGMYTAPGSAGTGVVTATSTADPSKSATAAVTIKVATSPEPSPATSVPAIKSFNVTPTTIQASQTASLQWSVVNATSLEVSGIGAVSGASVQIMPVETTTYTLTATNASGSVSESVTIGVQQGTSLAGATVDASKPGIQVPASFVGLAHPFSERAIMGLPGHPNPIYRQLMKNLLAYGAGPLLIRIGRDSTSTNGQLTTTAAAPMADLAADIGAKFTLGVNLESDDVQIAIAQAQNYVANMPAGSVEAIEIGNEPDLYVRDHKRASTYTLGSYFAQFATWRTRIVPLLPQGVKLMGPSWSSVGSLPNLPAFLEQERNNLSIVSVHHYAGSSCDGNTNPPDYLLQDSAATRGAQKVASSVALAHQKGLPFRMGEMNSIACEGGIGVADTFASALWAVDTLFEFASVGVDGVNFHSGHVYPYALFLLNSKETGGSTTFSVQSIRPDYYGVLFFQQATANRAKLLPITLTTQANVKAWATLDSKGAIRVVLINKDKTADGVVNISLPGFGSGVVTRLSAANYQATTGITIGGQTFDGSSDGKPHGAAFGEKVAPAGAVYSVALPKTSAAILTIQP